MFVFSALSKTGQLRSNRLGLATGLIFLSCAAGHFGHFMSYVAPYLATTDSRAGQVAALLFQCSLGTFGAVAGETLSSTAAAGADGAATATGLYSWPLAVIDTLTAAIAVYYVTLRRHYRKLLDDDETGNVGMFVDLSQQERNALREAARTEAVEELQHKSQFLASMSHEIRTPLNGVLGMAELLRNSGLDDRQQRFTQTLVDSGNHLMTIVDEILDLARIESGRLELNDEDFDLRALLARVDRSHQPLAAEKQTTVQITVDPAIPQLVRGDASRLRQVVSNLVSNAIKFTEHGAITVGITPTPSDEGRLGLRFTVSDTGIGMSEAVLPTLFEPFVQANAAISGTYGGSGLGLTICRELVELMGGDIEVTSRPGEGTTFTCTLMLARARAAIDTSDAASSPAVDISQPTDAHAATVTPDARTAPPGPRAPTPDHATIAPHDETVPLNDDPARAAGTPGRVLIVEDNAVNQEITYETLRWLGLEADVVSDGAAALEALDAGPFYDAILMDCRMPVMDGYEATRRIRQRSDVAARVPIIAMTR